MKRFLFDTWYGALVVWCGASGCFLAALSAGIVHIRLPSVVLLVLLALSFLAGLLFFAAWIVSLVKRRWKRALLQIVTGIVCLAGMILALGMLFVMSFFGPSEDHFADTLTIPAEVEKTILVPEKEIHSPFYSAEDTYDDDFSRSIFAALAKAGGDDPTVTCDLSALASLVHNRREELMAYLARHPGWWLHEEHGRLCATRRWRNQGVWNHPLHGYYSGNTSRFNHKDDFESYRKATHYQTRTTIGFPYSPFGRDKGAEHASVSTICSDTSIGNLQSYVSCERFGDKSFCVEVFEESSARERRITNAVLASLKDEFLSLTKLPLDTIVRGPVSFVLRNAMQSGIYNLTLRINPGEPGLTYLKAFEVTKGTQLSERRLKGASNERVGWSNDVEEKFLYENQFTIYEGDWGKPYAARIEVWFQPDSGKPERKLMERVCKIEGWQR